MISMISSWACRFGLLFTRGCACAVVLLVGVGGVWGLVPVAAARKSSSETINTTLFATTLPNKSGGVETYHGTFSASGTVSDSGTVTSQALFGAVPSPVIGVQQQVRTYSGRKGTLTLRCNERLFPPGQHANVETQSGSCVVLDATGAYAGLKGPGSLAGTVDSSATPVTLQDTLVL
jgi:hypothetical protein